MEDKYLQKSRIKCGISRIKDMEIKVLIKIVKTVSLIIDNKSNPIVICLLVGSSINIILRNALLLILVDILSTFIFYYLLYFSINYLFQINSLLIKIIEKYHIVYLS